MTSHYYSPLLVLVDGYWIMNQCLPAWTISAGQESSAAIASMEATTDRLYITSESLVITPMVGTGEGFMANSYWLMIVRVYGC